MLIPSPLGSYWLPKSHLLPQPLSTKRYQPLSTISQRLTHVHKAHDHVCLGEETAVLQTGQGWPLSAEDGLVRVGETFATFTGALFLHRHSIVEVQHEHGSRVVLAVQVGPRPVRQAQDGQDLPLHLPALLAPEPPVDETRVHLVLQGEVRQGAPQLQSPEEDPDDPGGSRQLLEPLRRVHLRHGWGRPAGGGVQI